tara:strand:- start:242 stop:439 length:198 start_codon:yes stop_codon:yes gene_type:complete
MFSDEIDFFKQTCGDNHFRSQAIFVQQLKVLLEKEKNNLSEENREIIFTKLNKLISAIYGVEDNI